MLVQLTLNGISTAAGIFLMAASFGLINRCFRFFHFSHGIVFTASAYFAVLMRRHDAPVWFACLLGVVVAAAIGLAFEQGVYRPLRSRSATPLVLLLASLGLYILGRNAISLFFGEETHILRTSVAVIGWPFLGGRITTIQLATILSSAVVGGILGAFLSWTKVGRIIRCIGDNSALAISSGVRVERYYGVTMALGSAFAGLAGVMAGLDTDVAPDMGMNPLMAAVVAVVIGGAGRSLWGVGLAALGIGLLQQFGVLWVGSAWQNAIVFAVLLFFLLLRPTGFRGLVGRALDTD